MQSAIQLRAHSAPLAEIAAALQTDLQRGLSHDEAQRRLAQYGWNELPSAPPAPAWRRLLAQFESPLVLLLLAATAISLVVWLIEREASLPFESLAILAIVLFNAALGFIQEQRAERSLAALKTMAAATASVIRAGERCEIPAREVVPGDVLIVEEGDAIAADARLFEVAALQTNEAALTGESLPVTKTTAAMSEATPLSEQRNMVFSGTTAVYGHGKAVVVATGARAEIGKVATLLQQTTDDPTPLQQEIARVGRWLGVAVVVIAVVIVLVTLLTQPVRNTPGLVSVMLFGVSLAVAAVPEGLATVLTILLAIGVQRMARRNAIVRKLAAVETLGASDVICTDKTGTLTFGEMTARRACTASGEVTFIGSGYAPYGEALHEGQPIHNAALAAELELALRIAALANNSALTQRDGRWIVQGDPTEGALLVAAAKLGLSDQALHARFPRLAEQPFSSERKMMSTLHRDPNGGLLLCAKGAPDVLLQRCAAEQVGKQAQPLSAERREAIRHLVDRLASQGMRTIGIAYRPLSTAPSSESPLPEEQFVFVGVIGISDPPRPEAKEAVARAQQAGIRVVMITGDHPLTAQAIASEVGIAEADAPVISGAELDAMQEATLREVVPRVSCYARVSPEHKLRLVKALREQGHVVAMTGDGVNDAPALRYADIGVAMGITGTDVAKEAADMVLVDDNFASIVGAVEEGRTLFANIRRFLRYLLSSNLGEVITMFLGVLLAGVIGLRELGSEELILPLLAVQILWINLITDAGPALALGIDPSDVDVMRQQPRPRHEPVINAEMAFGMFVSGLVMAISTLVVLDAALPGGWIAGSGSLDYARTMAFNTLVLAQLFNAFNSRSERRSAFADLWRNPWLWLAVLASAALQVAVIYAPLLQLAFHTTPLTIEDWLGCVGAASAVLWVREAHKWVRRARQRPGNSAAP